MMSLFNKKLSNLPLNHKRFIRKCTTKIPNFLLLNSNLNFLALAYGTDKKAHGYIPYYQQHFKPIRKQRLRILEIGIGGYEDPKEGGHSLRMWKAYFPKSMIYGIDMFDKRQVEEYRITTFRGSQNDPEFLHEISDRVQGFDIVIDDGSHIGEHTVTSFENLFPKLNDGGIYVIEDLHTSYWPHFGRRAEDHNGVNIFSAISMLKNRVDGLNYQFNPNKRPSYFDKNVVSLHFYAGIAFIYKGNNYKPIPEYMSREIEAARKIVTCHEETKDCH